MAGAVNAITATHRVIDEWHPTTHSKPVQTVSDLETFLTDRVAAYGQPKKEAIFTDFLRKTLVVCAFCLAGCAMNPEASSSRNDSNATFASGAFVGEGGQIGDNISYWNSEGGVDSPGVTKNLLRILFGNRLIAH